MLKLTLGSVFLSFSIVSLASISDQCQEFSAEYPNLKNQDLAKKLYEKAFIHQLNGQWQQAQSASECSLLLMNGQNHWAVETLDVL